MGKNRRADNARVYETMRIGIDARLYREGLGIGRYIEQLLAHLESLDTDDEYIIFLRKDKMDSYQPSSQRFHKVCLDVPWYSLTEQVVVPFVLYLHKLDLVHFPHFNVPIAYAGKYVVTIHDLLMMKHAESSRSAASSKHAFIHYIKYECYRLVVRCACSRAKKIITVSQSVKNDLISILFVRPEKIQVIYEGVHTFHGIVAAPLPEGVHKPYFLNVGNAYPHKNLSLLLDVFEHLKKENAPYMLVLCGQEDYFRTRLLAEITSRHLNNSIIHLGCVSDQQLVSLYKEAQGAIFPSFEEGFGFGALEAASLGTPVITSNINCFKETLSDAAITIDPRDAHAMIAAIRKLESDKALRKDCIERGRKRANLFSWNTTARATYAIYHELIEHTI